MSENLERRSYCDYCDDYGHDMKDHDNDGPMCECGHFEADHHISWFMASEYFPKGGKLVEECEFWGFNERGGMEYHADGTWTGHCDRFKEAK